jgi:hypothetical protein
VDAGNGCSTPEVSVTITRQDKYRFLVDFGPAIAPTLADEPPPLGDGAGPSPTQLLAAAIANCLSSSLLFAHGKFFTQVIYMTNDGLIEAETGAQCPVSSF